MDSYRKPTDFYRIVKKIRKSKSTANPPYASLHSRFQQIFAPREIAKESIQKLSNAYRSKATQSDTFKRFSIAEIHELLQSLGKNKASFGGISIELFQSSGLERQMTFLINALFAHGFVPRSMLQSQIFPLKKDRTKLDTDPNNYRPVALVCAFSKLLEAALKSRIDFNDCKSQYAYKTGWGLEMRSNVYLTGFKRIATGMAAFLRCGSTCQRLLICFSMTL